MNFSDAVYLHVAILKWLYPTSNFNQASLITRVSLRNIQVKNNIMINFLDVKEHFI